MVSRLCEEFGGYPTRALWELEHDPEQMAVTILELRAYARAFWAYRDVKDMAELDAAIARQPMVARVRDIDHAIAVDRWGLLRAAAAAEAEAEDI
jgi:hypothetical protein